MIMQATNFPNTIAIEFDASAYRQDGFALVATLRLLILLTVVAVGLLTVSSVSLRLGAHGKGQAESRANARFAMMMALAQLQPQAGPDQRATAVAGVVKPASQNISWAGVWSSTERAPIADNEPIANRPVVGAYEIGPPTPFKLGTPGSFRFFHNP